MRRVWLTVLLALSLAFGGTMSAWAAQNCPYKSAPAMHDCCPDGMAMGKPTGEHTSKKPADCQLGQACRASIAVPPTLPVLTIAAVEPARPALVMTDADGAASPAFSFWRPPRTV